MDYFFPLLPTVLLGKLLPSSHCPTRSACADSASSTQVTAPLVGLTICAGRAPGSACVSSTRCTTSALPMPVATKSTLCAALMAGSDRVMRWAGGFGLLATGSTHRPLVSPT